MARHEFYDTQGNLIAVDDPPLTQEQLNTQTLRQQVTTAIQIFENADANWATLTAAQRNDVLKLAVRSLARLGRIINNQLDAT